MLIPDIEAFEERAALVQFEGKLPRTLAEELAAKEQGFDGREHYWRWLADYAVGRRLPPEIAPRGAFGCGGGLPFFSFFADRERR